MNNLVLFEVMFCQIVINITLSAMTPVIAHRQQRKSLTRLGKYLLVKQGPVKKKKKKNFRLLKQLFLKDDKQVWKNATLTNTGTKPLLPWITCLVWRWSINWLFYANGCVQSIDCDMTMLLLNVSVCLISTSRCAIVYLTHSGLTPSYPQH